MRKQMGIFLIKVCELIALLAFEAALVFIVFIAVFECFYMGQIYYLGIYICMDIWMLMEMKKFIISTSTKK